MGKRALGAFAVCVFLAGCGTGSAADPASTGPTAAPTLTADAAWERYGDLPDRLTAAISAEFPEVTWATHREARVGQDPDTSECALNLPDYRTDVYLAKIDGDRYQLVATRRAMGPILAEYGFGAISEASSDPGGQSVVKATGPDGARLSLTSKGGAVLRVSGIALDPGACVPGEFAPSNAPPPTTPAPDSPGE